MSGLREGAPDPLTALRSSDRRPRSVVWRERVTSVGLADVTAFASRAGVVALVVAVAIGLGWRLFVESEPPVEASIPFATGAAAEPSVVGAVADGAVPSATGVPVSSADPAVTVEAIAIPVEPDAGVEVVIHVAGAVSQPGVVRGRSTWRVDDAVRAAGGPTTTADLDRINLAALIVDGQRIYVPHLDVEVPALVVPDTAAMPGEESAAALINLNTADASGLEQLPGVGPATAAAIISHREEHGAFGNVDALVAVAGIGPATLESLRDHVTV